MQCNKYIQNLTNIHSLDELSPEERDHIKNCSECEKETQAYLSFLLLVEKEKQTAVSPFISTRIMGKLQKTQKPFIPKLQTILLNTAVVIFTLMLGFISAYILDKNKIGSEQEQIVSQYFSSTSAGLNIEDNWLNNELYEE